MSYREVVIVNQDIAIDILVEGNLARRVTTGLFPSELHEILLNNPIVVNCTQDFYFPEINDKWDGTRNGVPLNADAYIMDVSGIDMQGKRIKKQEVFILVK